MGSYYIMEGRCLLVYLPTLKQIFIYNLSVSISCGAPQDIETEYNDLILRPAGLKIRSLFCGLYGRFHI